MPIAASRYRDTDPPRVLLLAAQPFFRVSGTPINILMMCRALTENGIEVHLVTLPHGEDVTMPGLTVHRLPRLPGVANVPVGFSGAKLLYNGIMLVALGWLLLRRRFDVVHAVEEAAFYAAPLARLFGTPAITDLDSDLGQQLRDHPSGAARALAAPAGWLRRLALRHSAFALTVAPRMTELVRSESPATPVFEITDIPMPEAMRVADPKRMAGYRAALDLDGRRVVVYTGNYDHRQGLDELIRALPAVGRAHPDAVLLVVGGEPPQIRALQTMAEDLGVGPAVRLIGARRPATMADYMGLAEVLVSPRLEPHATPLKIFSYMASGRPIVATDLPTHTQILDETTAILVPATAAGLAAGLIEALDDPAAAAARGERARRRVLERHTYAIFKGRLGEAYATVVRAGGMQPRSIAAQGST